MNWDDDYTITKSGKLLLRDYGTDEHEGQYYEISLKVRQRVCEKLRHVSGVEKTSVLDSIYPNLYQLFSVNHPGGWRIECYGDAPLGSPSPENPLIHERMRHAKCSGIVDTDMFCTDFSHFDYYVRTFSARVLEHWIDKLRTKDCLSPEETKRALITIMR